MNLKYDILFCWSSWILDFQGTSRYKGTSIFNRYFLSGCQNGRARVVELVDTQDLGSCAAMRGGSKPEHGNKQDTDDSDLDQETIQFWFGNGSILICDTSKNGPSIDICK